MWSMIVSFANAVAGRLMVGFVDACSAHPVLVAGFIGLMLGLVLMLWAEMLEVRRGMPRLFGRRAADTALRSPS